MLDKLAPHSRVWIYQANRFFNAGEENSIRQGMSRFVPQWASHGNEIYGDFEVAESLFLVVGADEQKSPTSGCSIDSLNRFVMQMGDELKINFFDRLLVAYRDDDATIKLVPIAGFKSKLKQGIVKTATPVFNNLVTTKEELDTKWRSTVNESWHKNLADV